MTTREDVLQYYRDAHGKPKVLKLGDGNEVKVGQVIESILTNPYHRGRTYTVEELQPCYGRIIAGGFFLSPRWFKLSKKRFELIDGEIYE